MSITSISNVDYSNVANGKKINSAADDAAGLAIAEKLKSQTNGYDTSADNASAAKDMLNTADGGLDLINDALQRMRELSIQASNTAIYSSSDIANIQKEIEQLKGTIQDAAKGTQFNTMSLLDGSKASWDIASNPDGSGMNIQMVNSTLESLGIADYDVTGNFDISVLDAAISKITSARSDIGATSNALDAGISNNSYASYNLTSAQSRIEDADMAKSISEMKKEKLLQEYQLYFSKKKMEDEKASNNRLLHM